MIIIIQALMSGIDEIIEKVSGIIWTVSYRFHPAPSPPPIDHTAPRLPRYLAPSLQRILDVETLFDRLEFITVQAITV